MKRTVTISVDQLSRPQPGGIATYVRGLAQGLAQLDDADLEVLGLGPWGSRSRVRTLPLRLVAAPAPLRALTLLWPLVALGVPRRSAVVHATSMAGPFGGGRRGAVHSVAMHDLLWRDEPGATTESGIRFHEGRLQLLRQRGELRIFTTSPGLAERLTSEGFSSHRLHPVRLGADDDTVAADRARVTALLTAHHVRGPFTLYVGTREPRKNIERLISAHRLARAECNELGPLVLAGPAGWGGVDTSDATVLGPVDRDLLKGLYRDATVVAYVARAEGWGLPPVEALQAGTRVVASTTTPSVTDNDEVVFVDPLDVMSIAGGLAEVLGRDDDRDARARRRASVSQLTWRNSALDHLAGWL